MGMTPEEQARYLHYLREAIRTDPNMAKLKFDAEMQASSQTTDPQEGLMWLYKNQDPRMGQLPDVVPSTYGQFLSDKRDANEFGVTPAMRRDAQFSDEDLDLLDLPPSPFLLQAPSGPPLLGLKDGPQPTAKANEDALTKQLMEQLANK